MVKQGTKRAPAATVKWRRRIGQLSAAIAVAGLLQVTGLPVFHDAGFRGIQDAQAQRARREKPKTKKTNTVGKKVGEQLLKAQEAMGEDNNAEALAILNRLLQSEMKPYEKAIVLRMIGVIYADNGDYKKSISFFEQTRRLNALDEQGQLDLLFYLGQLYLAEDRVDDAINTLETWFRGAGDSAAPQAYFVLAQAYALKENYRRALELSESGLAKARAIGTMRENWLAFTANMYYQNEDVKSMQGLLREIVKLYPGQRRYWVQLAGTYGILDDIDTAYYMRILMYIQDMTKKSNDLANLASMHISYETPMRGARILAKGFAEDLIDTKKADNYETLSIAYQEAREWKKSIQPLTRAASLADDGDLYIRLCQSYLYDREYKKAEKACADGIKKGDLRQPGGAWMLLGTARYNNGKLADARKAFVSAARYERNERNAQRWIRFLDQEIRRAAIRKAAASGS
jgi:tetratricopeptide (TPR) repeat protein